MKIKYILLICIILVSTQNCQKPSSGKRKIKLSDQRTATITDDQLTTTIHLEPTLRRVIAVMFFDNQTGDQNLEWLQKGLTEMFIRALSQSPYLSVLSTDRLYEIFDRLDQTASPEEMDTDMAAVVAREANVEALLTGNIFKSGDSLQIHVKVHEPTQGQILKEESVEGPGLENIFSMVDDLTQKIKNDLRITLEKAEPKKGIAELTTNSLEAWRFYSSGVDLLNKFQGNEAIPYFEKAIALDSAFVLAYIKLCPMFLGRNRIDEALGLFNKLQTLREKATPQERYQIDLLEGRFNHDAIKIVTTIQEWLQKYPDDRDANYTLAELHRKWNNFEQAIIYYKNVLTIDPKDKLAHNILGYMYANVGDFSKAISSLNKYKELTVDESNPYDSMGEIYLWYGDYKKAEKHFKKALEINEDFTACCGNLAYLYLEKGEYNKALKSYKEFLEKASDDPTQSNAYSMIARTYWRLGEKDSAIANYEKSLEKNIFNFSAVERLTDIYLEIHDSTKAQDVLLQTYDGVKEYLESDVMRLNAIGFLSGLSIFRDFNMDETIDILIDAIERTRKATPELTTKLILTDLKQILTLFYIKTKRTDEIEKLWEGQEVIPTELWTIFREARHYNYSESWKGFSILNSGYYQDINSGISFYKPLIKNTLEYDIKPLEMIFRLFLADLYLHAGNVEETNQQLKIVGVPIEEKWLVIGPFDNKDGFRKKFPPEKRIRLDETYKEKSWKVSWRHAEDGTDDGFINLRGIYERNKWAVGYGLVYVKSPDNKKVQFRMGTDDGSKVWLNNEKIWAFNQTGPAIFDDNKINVTLNQGLNKIMIKVCNGIGDWGFFFRITDEEGNGVPDIQFVSPDALGETT